ncbi:PIN domain-containing protein [Methylotetracoccus oryzae]|uniref:PIN domain-containing protein n=1 Tax=Methylotetracoccus oryzae TaxID=1919059 RepID=UPI0013A54140|nr:PIN domain-containing protein [Methylotetracoccus oryzae]
MKRGRNGSQNPLIAENCFAHAVNLCEVYCGCIRVDGEDKAEALIRDLKDAGVTNRSDIDEDFWKDVGQIKASIGRVSLADCFAIALARRLNVAVGTSDHDQFDKIAAHEICVVEFIR